MNFLLAGIWMTFLGLSAGFMRSFFIQVGLFWPLFPFLLFHPRVNSLNIADTKDVLSPVSELLTVICLETVLPSERGRAEQPQIIRPDSLYVLKACNLWHRQSKVSRRHPAGLVPCSLLRGKRKPARHRAHQGLVKFALLTWGLHGYKLPFGFLLWKLCSFNKHVYMKLKLKNISLLECSLASSFQTSPEIWKAHFWGIYIAIYSLLLRVGALLHKKECMTEL